MAKANPPSAWLLSEQMMVRYVEDSVEVPAVCKNIMVRQIHFQMTALRQSIGAIELAARRADCYGVDNEIEQTEEEIKKTENDGVRVSGESVY
jgi:hypothetical protein